MPERFDKYIIVLMLAFMVRGGAAVVMNDIPIAYKHVVSSNHVRVGKVSTVSHEGDKYFFFVKPSNDGDLVKVEASPAAYGSAMIEAGQLMMIQPEKRAAYTPLLAWDEIKYDERRYRFTDNVYSRKVRD